MRVTIKNYRALHSGDVRGVLTVVLPAGIVLHDVALRWQGTKWTATMQKRMVVTAAGVQPRGRDGKPLYVHSVSFETEADKISFSDAVIAALRIFRPDVLQ